MSRKSLGGATGAAVEIFPADATSTGEEGGDSAGEASAGNVRFPESGTAAVGLVDQALMEVKRISPYPYPIGTLAQNNKKFYLMDALRKAYREREVKQALVSRGEANASDVRRLRIVCRNISNLEIGLARLHKVCNKVHQLNVGGNPYARELVEALAN